MAYNLRKQAAKNKDKDQSPLSVTLPENSKKYNLSIDKYTNFNAYLENDRRPLEGQPVTHEGMLEKTRKEAKKADKITEGSLSDAKSSLYPHRQFAKGEDKFDVTPINMLSEAYDQKWRNAFTKANKGADTEFWDKYLHNDLDDKPTKIIGNVPKSGSQLSDNAERFKKLESLPVNEDASTNRSNFDKEIKVDRLHYAEAERMQKIAYQNLAVADKSLFAIYAQAKAEARELNAEEKEIINEINAFKENMIVRLADSMYFNDKYRGDEEFQRELFERDPIAADPQMTESIEPDDDDLLDDINLGVGAEDTNGDGDAVSDEENSQILNLTDEDDYNDISSIEDSSDNSFESDEDGDKDIPF